MGIGSKLITKEPFADAKDYAGIDRRCARPSQIIRTIRGK